MVLIILIALYKNVTQLIINTQKNNQIGTFQQSFSKHTFGVL